MEQAAAVGDTHKMHQLLKLSSKKYSYLSDFILDLQGSLITNLEDRQNRCRDHFKLLLSHDTPPALPPQLPCDQEYECDVSPLAVEEIASVINKLKNNKDPGEDGLPVEIFKCGSQTLSRRLHKIFAQVWQSEELPQDWSDAVILPFFMKGDKKTCQNHRYCS